MTALSPVRTVPPAALPLSLLEAKQHLRVEHDEHDELIEQLLFAATEELDGPAGILGVALVTQTWRVDSDAFPAVSYRLPVFPVQSILSVQYYASSASVLTTVASANYSLFTDGCGSGILPASGYSWPAVYARSDAVQVTFLAGYGDPDAVPFRLKAAIALHVQRLYEALPDGAMKANNESYRALAGGLRRMFV